MYQLNNKERRVGGLLLEALMLVFLFSSALSDTEFVKYDGGSLVVTASRIEQMAFRDFDSYGKSLLDIIAKVPVLADNFVEFFGDVVGLEVKNTSRLYVAHSLYNPFYIHLTAKAP